MTVEEACKKVESFVGLEPNWNSYGAEPISVHAIAKAHNILRLLNSEPQWVVPLPNGGVGIEWNRNLQALELEIDPLGAIEAEWHSAMVDVGVDDDNL